MWHSYHLWSPRDRRIAAELGGETNGLAVLDRDGAVRAIPGASEDAVLRGWVARPLPTAPRKPGPSRDVAMLTRAVELARHHAERLDADVVVRALERSYAALGDAPPRVDFGPDLVAAMLAGPTVAVADLDGYCIAVELGRANGIEPRPIGVAGDYIVVAHPIPDDEILDPAPTPASEDPDVLARFPDVGGAAIDLVDMEIPTHVTRGASFPARLRWRFHRAPPRGWSAYVHVDRGPFRFQSINSLQHCSHPSRLAPAGSVLDDTFGLHATHHLTGIPPGSYEVFVGWYRYGGPRAAAESDTLPSPAAASGSGRSPSPSERYLSVNVNRRLASAATWICWYWLDRSLAGTSFLNMWAN